MQKVYTVLKNNKQEGPYSLHELQHLALKPTDLIWVEGRSAAWSYPSEIKELQSLNLGVDGNSEQHLQRGTTEFRTNSILSGSKKIFVSLPGGNTKKIETREATPVTNIEEKAEALRQRILNHQPPAPTAPEELVETRLKRTMEDVAGDFAKWTTQHKNKNKKFNVRKKELLITITVLLVLTGVYVMFPKSAPQNLTAEKNDAPVTKEQLAAEDSNPDLAFEPSVSVENEQQRESKQANTNTPQQVQGAQKEKTRQIVLNKSTQQQPAITETIDPIVQEEPQEIVATKEPEKKKTIGEAIDVFFGKFKNKKNESAERGTTTSDGERKSNKREEASAAEPQTVDVTSQVKLSTNAPRDNWMLGIKGQKLTLQNNSKAAINSAWVTIEYYSEDDTLLDTKKIEFKNIKPAQKATLPIPDHRLASYTTQQVTTAMGTLQ